MHWIVTRDHIGAGNCVGFGSVPALYTTGGRRLGYVNLCDPDIKSWASTLEWELTIYDDDGNLYFSVLASEADFDPQDCFEGSHGVTYTMCRRAGSNDEWQLL